MIGEKKTSEALEEILTSSGAAPVEKILKEYSDKMVTGDRPFTEYMRKLFREKGIRQKDLFIAADIPERSGRRIISGEKHTSDRDTILRICVAGDFSLDETQRALKLYGMSPLYSRDKRDAVILYAIAHGKKDLWEIDETLDANGLERIMKDG